MKQTLPPPPATCAPTALLLAWRRLRQGLFHDKAGAFPVALRVRLSAFAPLALAAALLVIPADQARAHDDTSATLHAKTYPLHSAAVRGFLDSVNHFLAVHMATVNAEDDDGKTPLHKAAAPWTIDTAASPFIVATLLAAGADVNAKDNRGRTPLIAAFGSPRYAAAASVLITAGADVNATENGGWTALHYAVQSPPSLFSMLIAAGASVNAKSDTGNTPLRNFWDAGTYYYEAAAPVVSVLIAAGGHWGEPCEGAAVVNQRGPSAPCICQSPNVDTTSGACEVVVSCAAPSVLNAGTNRCDCPAPNVGADGADAPGDCVAASAESCEGLNPAKFYDSAAGECVAVAECAAPAVLNAGANRCDCPAPNVGTDGADAPGDCVAASAESCGGLNPAEVLRFGGGGMCRGCGMRRASGFECGGEPVRLSRAECRNGRGGRAGGLCRRQRGKLRRIDSAGVLRFGGGGLRPVCGLPRFRHSQSGQYRLRMSERRIRTRRTVGDGRPV